MAQEKRQKINVFYCFLRICRAILHKDSGCFCRSCQVLLWEFPQITHGVLKKFVYKLHSGLYTKVVGVCIRIFL